MLNSDRNWRNGWQIVSQSVAKTIHFKSSILARRINQSYKTRQNHTKNEQAHRTLTTIEKIHKVQAPKFQGLFDLLKSAKRRRHAHLAPPAKSNEDRHNAQGTCPQKSRGVFLLRLAKRRRHAHWAHQAYKNNKNANQPMTFSTVTWLLRTAKCYRVLWRKITIQIHNNCINFF